MASANTLESTFNVQPPDSGETMKNDGRKLNGNRPRGKNSENLHKINFKSIAKIGLGIRQVRMANELVGAYTGDRITQRSVQTGMTFVQYGIGIKVAGVFGMAYAAGDLAFRTLNHQIKVRRENTIARHIKELSGNNARNHSRRSGEKI